MCSVTLALRKGWRSDGVNLTSFFSKIVLVIPDLLYFQINLTPAYQLGPRQNLLKFCSAIRRDQMPSAWCSRGRPAGILNRTAKSMGRPGEDWRGAAASCHLGTRCVPPSEQSSAPLIPSIPQRTCFPVVCWWLTGIQLMFVFVVCNPAKLAH